MWRWTQWLNVTRHLTGRQSESSKGSLVTTTTTFREINDMTRSAQIFIGATFLFSGCASLAGQPTDRDVKLAGDADPSLKRELSPKPLPRMSTSVVPSAQRRH